MNMAQGQGRGAFVLLVQLDFNYRINKENYEIYNFI